MDKKKICRFLFNCGITSFIISLCIGQWNILSKLDDIEKNTQRVSYYGCEDIASSLGLKVKYVNKGDIDTGLISDPQTTAIGGG